jgi:dTMP kinase
MTLAPFLALDGIDGTGKSTQCRLLVEWLARVGVPVVACAEPGGTPLGDQLRQMLLGTTTEMSARAESLLFMASRAELVQRVIQPAIEAGKVVVCDRFVTATAAYQGHARGLEPNEIWAVGRFATAGLFPDLTILLDLPVEKAIARRQRAADRVEGRGPDYLDRVRQGFLAEAKRQADRITVVDAGPAIDVVQQRIRVLVAAFLRKRGVAVRSDA